MPQSPYNLVSVFHPTIRRPTMFGCSSGFYLQVPIPAEAEQQGPVLLILQQQPTPKVLESSAQFSSGLLLISKFKKSEETDLPNDCPTSHPECHELARAMNWTDGIPITASIVKILKNVSQGVLEINLRS